MTTGILERRDWRHLLQVMAPGGLMEWPVCTMAYWWRYGRMNPPYFSDSFIRDARYSMCLRCLCPFAQKCFRANLRIQTWTETDTSVPVCMQSSE